MGINKMKLWKVYCYINIILLGLILIGGCSYVIPESNNFNSRTTKTSRFLENEQKDIHGENIIQAYISIYNEDVRDIALKRNLPVSDLTIIPENVLTVGMNIYFYADSSLYEENDSFQYYWDFGDGRPLFGPTPHNPVCHTFLINGEYLIRLIVIDDQGNFGEKEMVIHI